MFFLLLLFITLHQIVFSPLTRFLLPALNRLARALQAEEDAITAQRHQDQEQARRRDQVRLPAGVQQRAEQRTADDNTGRKDRKDKAKTDHGGKGKEKDKKCMIM